MAGSFFVSVRDTAVVARFHLMKSVRTRAAAVLCIALVLVHMGGAWVFTEILKAMENSAAEALRVPTTDRPGAMLSVLRDRDDFRDLITGMLPDPSLLEWALNLPYLSIGHFWIALGTLPFIAAAAGSEVLSADISNRSLRFEVVRTGRLEVVAGRFLGQALLVFLAILVANTGTWVMAMVAMVEQPAVAQMATLLAFTPRLCAWALPFLGLGIGASMLTANPNTARVLALSGTVATFIAWGFLQGSKAESLGALRPALDLLFPQSQMLALWDAGFGWVAPAAILVVFGVAVTVAAFPLFARRNL
jgi:ABC-type transport system involved in multi-copper enzyme maturation permease subunit